MRTLWSVIVFISVAAPAAGVPVALATGGQPRCELVVKETADPDMAAAVADLEQYFTRITGAALPTTDQPTGEYPVILRVGSQWLDEATRTRISDLRYGEEAFILRVATDEILLAGTGPVGTRHGIYRLLRRWGCRWYFPGELGEVVPNNPDLAMASGERLEQPSFRLRRLWYAAWDDSYFPPNAKSEYHQWCLRNCWSDNLGFGGHSYYRIVPKEKYRQESPEYLALVHGQRAPVGNEKHDWQPCTSHPDVVQLAIDYTRDRLAKGHKVVSVSPNDGGVGSFCQCERCKAQGTISDRVTILANRVAEAIADEYPDRWVGFYAYSAALMPPSPGVEVHDNVVVFVARNGCHEIGEVDWLKSLFAEANARWKNEVLDPWSAKAKHLALRDYYGLKNWRDVAYDYSAFLDTDLPYLHEHGFIGVNAEALCNWVASGFTLYSGYQKLWDVNLSLKEERQRLYDDLFGPTSEHIVLAMNRMQQQSMEDRPLTDEDLAFCAQQLAAARAAAPDDLIRRRVDYVQGYYDYLAPFVRCWRDGPSGAQLRYRLGLGPAAEMRQAILAAQDSSAFAAKAMIKLHWLPAETSPEATNLHPLFPDEPVAFLADEAIYRARNMFIVWVDEGQALDFSIAGVRVGNNPGPTTHVILDPQGNIILGEPMDREDHQTVKLTDVPAGAYWIVIDPGSNAFQVEFRNRHAVLETGRIGVIMEFGGPKYFYVPEGTEHFILSVNAPGGSEVVDFAVRNPNEEVVLEKQAYFGHNEFTITVPEHHAGHVWSLDAGPHEDTEFVLSGVPPFLAQEPGRLLTTAPTR